MKVNNHHRRDFATYLRWYRENRDNAWKFFIKRLPEIREHDFLTGKQSQTDFAGGFQAAQFVFLRWPDRGQVSVPITAKAFAGLPGEPVDTLRAFVAHESTGWPGGPPKHPHVLCAIIQGKALLNMQIKQWAGGCRDAALIHNRVGLVSMVELQLEYLWLPEWVWTAVANQAGLKHWDHCETQS